VSSPRESLKKRASRIRALVLDVDGVLSDGTLFYGPGGEALKRFSARDGFAIKMGSSRGDPCGDSLRESRASPARPP